MRVHSYLLQRPPRLDSRRRSRLKNTQKFYDIMGSCSEHFKVSERAIIQPNRMKTTARARHVAMWFYFYNVNPSISETGRRFKRHHSTVWHAINKIDDLIEEYSDDIDCVRRLI